MRQKSLLKLGGLFAMGMGLAIAAPFGQAQPRAGADGNEGGERPARLARPGADQLQEVLRGLNLTEEQQGKVEKILRTHHEKMQRLMAGSRRDLLSQMKDVLSADQYKQVEQALQRDGPAAGRGERPRGLGGRQNPGGAPPGSPGGLEQMIGQLELTDEQKEKVQDLLRAHDEKMQKAFESNRAELLRQMKDVLDDEQYQQFEKALPGPGSGGRRPGGPPRRTPGGRGDPADKKPADDPDAPPSGRPTSAEPPPPRGPGGLERALEQLNLTDDQRDKLQEIIKAHHEKMQKLMEQSRKELLREMKDVLTEEQYKEFRKAMQNRPDNPRPPDSRRRPGGPVPDGPGSPGSQRDRPPEDVQPPPR